MSSLNRRVIVAVVGVTSLVVLVAAVALWFAMQSVLMRNADRELTSRVERLKRIEPFGSPEFWRSMATNEGRRRFLERGMAGDWRVAIQAIDMRDGAELYRSASLNLELDLVDHVIPPVAIDQPITRRLGDGSSVRLLAFHLTHQLRNDVRREWRDGSRSEGSRDGSRSDGPRPENQPSGERRPALPTDGAPLTTPTASASTPPTLTTTPAVATSATQVNASPTTITVTLASPTPSGPTNPPTPGQAPPNPGHEHTIEAPHQGVMIHLALGLESVDGELSRMAVVLGLLWAGATLLAFATILVLRPAVLRPTRDLAAAIARLGPDDLAARVPIERAPQEMRVVVDCLNGLFDRLEQAFKREQATIANIAHELRTPVAELRTALEFRQMTATGEDRTELDALLSTVIHMQTQVSNLLLLARLEAGKEPLQRSDCDLGELVSEAIERWEERAAARGLDLSAGTFARAPITTSPDHLGLVLDNLLGNAVAHATTPGVITIAVSTDEQTARFSITNPFAGKLDAEQLGRAYYRGDSARHGGDHTGLGLALCQRLCRVLDARLELAPADGHFRTTVVFPRKA